MISRISLMRKIILQTLFIIQVCSALPDYCDLVCPAPCTPSVTQEDATMAVVDWDTLWPGLAEDCIEEVTVVANGEAGDRFYEILGNIVSPFMYLFSVVD